MARFTRSALIATALVLALAQLAHATCSTTTRRYPDSHCQTTTAQICACLTPPDNTGTCVTIGCPGSERCIPYPLTSSLFQIDFGTPVCNDLDAKITGPSSATANAAVLFNGTSGTLAKSSGFTIDANGAVQTQTVSTSSRPGLWLTNGSATQPTVRLLSSGTLPTGGAGETLSPTGRLLLDSNDATGAALTVTQYGAGQIASLHGDGALPSGGFGLSLGQAGDVALDASVPTSAGIPVFAVTQYGTGPIAIFGAAGGLQIDNSGETEITAITTGATPALHVTQSSSGYLLQAESGSTGFLVSGNGSTGASANTTDPALWAIQSGAGHVLDLGTNISGSSPIPNWGVRQGYITTTNATPTTALSLVIAANMTHLIEVHVTARRTGGSSGTANDGAAYIIRGAYKTVSGTLTLIGSLDASFTAEDQAGWDATLVISGNNLLTQVAGAANNNVSWMVTAFLQEVGS